MILKVKEPVPEEFGLLREQQVLFTYLHLAADEALTRALVDRKVQAVAYETVQLANGPLPLLPPMSEVAGRMSVQVGAHYLEKTNGGRGLLMGGVPGVPDSEVMVIGGGIVGTNAAQIALGMGANVTVFDMNIDRLRYLDQVLHGRVHTMASNAHNIAEGIRRADLVIGSVLIPGKRAPKLVTREMVETMLPGSVMVDVAIDQGGCFETSRPTTHSEPTYEVNHVIHYCVANMPGAVPRTQHPGPVQRHPALRPRARQSRPGGRRPARSCPGEGRQRVERHADQRPRRGGARHDCDPAGRPAPRRRPPGPLDADARSTRGGAPLPRPSRRRAGAGGQHPGRLPA